MAKAVKTIDFTKVCDRDLPPELVYEGVKVQLARFVARSVPSQDVEDVMQDMYLRFLSAKGYRVKHREKKKSPLGWARRLASFVIINNYMRSEGRLGRNVGDEPLAGVVSERTGPSSKVSRMHIMHRILPLLPHKQRLVFLMSEGEGMTAKEIAAELLVPENTVFSNLKRAKARIKELLLDLMPELTQGAAR